LASATVNIRARFAWWWPLHHAYFALLLAAVRIGLLGGESAFARGARFARSALCVGVGPRMPQFKPFGPRFLCFTWYGWGINIWLWRRAKYLCVTWGRQGYRIYLSRNATPWAAYWGIGWFDGRFKWRHRGERCEED
jgi:hypothetical protein